MIYDGIAPYDSLSSYKTSFWMFIKAMKSAVCPEKSPKDDDNKNQSLQLAVVS